MHKIFLLLFKFTVFSNVCWVLEKSKNREKNMLFVKTFFSDFELHLLLLHALQVSHTVFKRLF